MLRTFTTPFCVARREAPLVTLFLDMDVAIFEDCDLWLYVVPIFKCLVADCPHILVSVTVGSLVPVTVGSLVPVTVGSLVSVTVGSLVSVTRIPCVSDCRIPCT